MNRAVALAGLLALASAARPADPLERRVQLGVEKVRSSDTDAWRRIPWAASLSDAAGAARREGRPLFVFSHEGNIETGRC